MQRTVVSWPLPASAGTTRTTVSACTITRMFSSHTFSVNGCLPTSLAIGVNVHRLCVCIAPAVEDDLHRLPVVWFETKRHLLVDEDSIDLVVDTIETDRPIFLHFPPCLEEKEIFQVQIVGVSDLITETGPAIEWRILIQSPVRCLVILAFNPRPQPSVEQVDTCQIILRQACEQPRAHRPKPAFYLPLRLRMVGSRMDQRDAELGHHELKMVRAVCCAIVDKQPLR